MATSVAPVSRSIAAPSATEKEEVRMVFAWIARGFDQRLGRIEDQDFDIGEAIGDAAGVAAGVGAYLDGSAARVSSTVTIIEIVSDGLASPSAKRSGIRAPVK